MESENYRAITPLFTSNINPYGVFTVDFEKPPFLMAALARLGYFLQMFVVAPNGSYVPVGPAICDFLDMRSVAISIRLAQ
jgi:hypothetical protein